MSYHTPMCWKPVAVGLQRGRLVRRRLRNPWPQRHMRTPGIVMRHPLLEHASELVLGERDQTVQTFLPQRAQEWLTEGIRLGPRG